MTEWQRKQEAKRRAQRELEETKKKYGITAPGPLRGITPNPLVSQPAYRQGNTIPTSDRIPASMAKSDILHEHKWKRNVQETVGTVQEIYRKATKIAPAYNKGALMYLPEDFDKL